MDNCSTAPAGRVGTARRVKFRPRSADAAYMFFASLPVEVWIAISFIAGLTVLQCLGMFAKALHFELEQQRLVQEVRALRREDEHRHAEVAEPKGQASTQPQDDQPGVSEVQQANAA